MGGEVIFVKKVDLSPQNETKVMLDFFYSLLIWRGGAYAPSASVSCFSKIQIGFSFLVPAHLGSSGKMAINVCERYIKLNC